MSNQLFEFPTYQLFGEEILSGAIQEVDSLSTVALLTEIEDRQGIKIDNLEEFEENFDNLSERERRMFLLRRGLSTGYEFETTMFGIPVVIQPVQEAGSDPPSPPPSGPDLGGDREPRQPRPPRGSLSAELEITG